MMATKNSGLPLLKVFMLSSLMYCSSMFAVTILDTTFNQYGFKAAEELALQPQFSSLFFLDGENDSGSGAWIGNYQGHGYILTAGHMFPKGVGASYYTYTTIDHTKYEGQSVYLNPLWNASSEERTGYDFAIVKLKTEVTNLGASPALYAGEEEDQKIITFIGYGWRGKGTGGEDTSIDTGNRPAAAVGLIEEVVEATDKASDKGDRGNYLGIWLPKEDGSLNNPFLKDGIKTPVSPLSGILGSGDSGGPAWIQTKQGWTIAGVNSDGSGNAAYGDKSWFARVSFVIPWIKEVVPSVKISNDQEPKP